MKRLFNNDSPIWSFLSWLADLSILNFFWLVCCIPVVTAGASTTALYRVTLNLADQRGSTVAKTFFSEFRSNFKQSTVVWLLILLASAVLCADFILIWNWDGIAKMVLLGIFMFSVFIVLCVSAYIFPLIAYFDNTVKNLLKNALLLGIRHLPKTIVMIVLNVFPLLLFVFLPNLFVYIGFIWLLFGFSSIAYINSVLLLKIFKNLPAVSA